MLFNKERDYQPIKGTDGQFSDAASDDEVAAWQQQRPPTVPRRAFVVTLALLCVSLAVNSLQLFRPLVWTGKDPSEYAHLPRDQVHIYQAQTEFQSKNRSVADAAWAQLDIEAGPVAISSRRQKEMGLLPSVQFPWDQDKSIYFVKAYHHTHCLKYMYRAVSSLERGIDNGIRFGHIYHCLDALRQEVVCDADDTPQPFDPRYGAFSLGQGLNMKCRNWEKMTEWAQQPEFDACFHEVSDWTPPKHTLESYSFCKEDSPYYPIKEDYFRIHGHKNVFGEGEEDH